MVEIALLWTRLAHRSDTQPTAPKLSRTSYLIVHKESDGGAYASTEGSEVGCCQAGLAAVEFGDIREERLKIGNRSGICKSAVMIPLAPSAWERLPELRA